MVVQNLFPTFSRLNDQCLLLLHTAAPPELADNVGNIALLQRAEVAGLLPAGMGQAAAQAYRQLQRVQHHARLNEEPTWVDVADLPNERDAA